jgi:parallel beta-helix repeat protein
VSGGVLYINVGSGANPSTQSVTYVYALCSFLTIEDCNSWDNFSDPRTPGTEGHGFAFDDYADNSIFRRNRSYDNEGFGFSINRGESNTLVSNIAFNNGGPGVFVNIGYNPSIINNTFTDNNRSGIHARAGEMSFGYGCKNGVVVNNILTGTKPYGIDNDPANPGFSGASNNIHGFTRPDRTGFTVGMVTVDPMLDAEFRPYSTALKRAGAYLAGKDFYGKQFYNPPNIGAVDDLTSTPRYALKNRKY